jgi:hypothetical protein
LIAALWGGLELATQVAAPVESSFALGNQAFGQLDPIDVLFVFAKGPDKLLPCRPFPGDRDDHREIFCAAGGSR